MWGSFIFVAVAATYFLFGVVASAEPVLDKAFYTADDEGFKQVIAGKRISVSDWLDQINSAPDQFLCLGETHRDKFREFVGRELLPHLKVEKLFLEVTEEQVAGFRQQFDAGQTSITMLGADVYPVLRAAWEGAVSVIGIEETEEQGRYARQANGKMGREFYSRDGYIAQNVFGHLQPKGLQVALYGALHCTKFDLGLGGKRPFMRHLAPLLKDLGLPGKNVLLMHHDSGDMLGLYFQMMGFGEETFVIPDTSKVKPEDFNYKWDLYQTFVNYDAVVYFGEKSESGSRR